MTIICVCIHAIKLNTSEHLLQIATKRTITSKTESQYYAHGMIMSKIVDTKRSPLWKLLCPQMPSFMKNSTDSNIKTNTMHIRNGVITQQYILFDDTYFVAPL